MQRNLNRPLTENEYHQWRTDPKSKKVFKWLKEREEDLKEEWVDGNIPENMLDYYRGFINGMREMFEIPREIERG
jgi:hypothetical protein